MRKNDKWNQRYDIFQAISITGLIACFIASLFAMYKQAILFQQNAIGSLYLQEQEYAKQYLYAIFDEITLENIHASWEVLEMYGYTEKGVLFFGSKMKLWESCMPIVILFIFFMLLFIFCSLQKRRNYQQMQASLEKNIQIFEKQQKESDYLQVQNRRIQNFVENIAHQIKTPVSRVVTSLDILEMDMENTEKQKHIEECYQHMESINILMKKLMDIGRMEAGKVLFHRELLFLNELLEDTVRGICINMERVRICCPKDMVYYGDYEWLKEAFSNILKNALEADSIYPIEITCEKTQDYVKIVIRDHGKGMHETDIPNIFDRFYQPQETKSNHNGIGLNLAKLIIEGHQGMVYAYNHANGGAVFRVNLPIYESLKYTKC